MSVFRKGNQTLAVMTEQPGRNKRCFNGLYVGNGNHYRRVAKFENELDAESLDKLLTEWLCPTIVEKPEITL